MMTEKEVLTECGGVPMKVTGMKGQDIHFGGWDDRFKIIASYNMNRNFDNGWSLDSEFTFGDIFPVVPHCEVKSAVTGEVLYHIP